MAEIWKDIPGYEGRYRVSDKGNVYSYYNNGLLSQINHNGYKAVYLQKKSHRRRYKVHRLVMLAFVGYEPEYEVNHIDGNKFNNNLENLEYCSAEENIKHAIRTGLIRRRPVSAFDSSGNKVMAFSSIAEAERETGARVTNCLMGKQKTSRGYSWKYEERSIYEN